MKDSLVQDLQRIGLSEKEAKVYLASLELGPSTAQLIAAKALVNRPTTYLMIESLVKRGLMGSFVKGKKKFFSASSPKQLHYIILGQKKKIEEAEVVAKTLIGSLGKMANLGTKGADFSVSTFEGDEALKNIFSSIDADKSKIQRSVVPIGEVRKFYPKFGFEGDPRINFKKKYNFKTIIAGKTNEHFQNTLKTNHRFLPNSNIKTEIIILDEIVIFTTFDGPIRTVIIKNKIITLALTELFEKFWDHSNK